MLYVKVVESLFSTWKSVELLCTCADKVFVMDMGSIAVDCDESQSMIVRAAEGRQSVDHVVRNLSYKVGRVETLFVELFLRLNEQGKENT